MAAPRDGQKIPINASKPASFKSQPRHTTPIPS